MNIFFDYQAFTLQAYGGISRYYCELITGINKTLPNKAHLSILWSNNIQLREYNIPVHKYIFPKRHRLLSKTNKLYNILDKEVHNYDIYHATYFDDFLGRYIKTRPFVTTFHDMTYERLSHKFAELSDDKWIIPQKKKIAERASHLIAVSESTKRDMIELLAIPAEKITVIHLGSSFMQSNSRQECYDTVSRPPYLLYVGNRAGYKNFIPFLRSIANLLTRYKINLICAGGGKFTIEEKNIIQHLSITAFVHHHAIDDHALKNLYLGATAFIFPSLYEGFGIPILEAFSCNCPCIVSNNSSLPEVAGEAALYIDPTEPDSIAIAVETLILDSTVRKKLIQYGQLRLTHFSWAHTVDETIKLYKKLL
ncbi:glycosyltransferase family 4 protein [Spirosoma koreense]